MQNIVIWKGIYYQSLEYCSIKFSEEQLEVVSTILGIHEGTEYKIDYTAIAKPNWEIVSCRIESRLREFVDVRTFRNDGEGNWTNNGQPISECKGCTYIDISLTPFTNTLPINRSQMQVNEFRRIKVLYINILEQTIASVEQQYTKISDYKYQYENVPNDFEAEITVDKWGLVKEYPGLFIRLNG